MCTKWVRLGLLALAAGGAMSLGCTPAYDVRVVVTEGEPFASRTPAAGAAPTAPAVRAAPSADGAKVQPMAGVTQGAPVELARPHRNVVPGVVMSGLAGAAVVTGGILMAESAARLRGARSLNASIRGLHNDCVAGAVNFDPRCPQLADVARTSDT